MNILYCSSSSYLDFDLPLLKAYGEAGHSVYFIVLIPPNGLKSTFVSISKQYPVEGLFDYNEIYPNEFGLFKEYTGVKKLYILNMLTNSLTFKTIKYEFQINKLIRKYKIEINHQIGIPGIMTLPAILLRKCKKVVTVHDPVPHEHEELFKIRVMRMVILKFIKNIILLNKVQTQEFKKHYHIHNAHIYYSRLGNCETLRLYGNKIESNYRTILFYGRISQYKGIDVLLKSFRIIEPYYNDVKLVIAGRGNFSFDITQYQNDPQIEIINDFISLDDLGSMIKSCEFAVCPYTSATQSGVVASVLALGKPLIVTNVGGLPSMIEDGKSGIVIAPNDSIQLANEMIRLLNDRELLESMCHYISKSSFVGDNSWGKISQNYLRIYNSL